MSVSPETAVISELKHLTEAFFRAVSFTHGNKPTYDDLYGLFIESGILIKNVGPSPEIATVSEFIQPRQASVDGGQLTHFYEAELVGETIVFGNIAHRFSSYTKVGTMNGTSFEARGVISTQFINTPAGWRMSAMAWDDERAGLTLPSGLDPGNTDMASPRTTASSRPSTARFGTSV